LNYESLLNTRTGNKWKKIGVKKRAGVAVPLFSLYSRNSTGIGEIPDLRHLIDWCVSVNMSIIQLLPLNDMGYDNAPYNAASTFALDPAYLSFSRLRYRGRNIFREDVKALKEKFPAGKGRVNYKIKEEKLKLLWKIYRGIDYSRSLKFKRFREANAYWLRDYALYKVIKEAVDNRSWEEWDESLKNADEKAKENISKKYKERVLFHYWLQWQLYEQFRAVKQYAESKKFFLMGDLPFLVSRDSADVWANQNYFKLKLVSGAPPDMYFANGQRWGMPPYSWNSIAKEGFTYIKERLKYAENFYDMFRIDHFVGLFRVWTIPVDAPPGQAGLSGSFDPSEEFLWEEHGKKILSVMSEATVMLPCAEDLGTVPECSNRVLEEFGVPGIDVQRWTKTYSDGFEFIKPEKYRMNSIAVVSTHDSSLLSGWWAHEAGTIDEIFFQRLCKNINISGERYKSVKKILFNEEYSGSGRLYWRNEVNNVYILLDILRASYEQAREIVDMYLASYGERRKFARYTGYTGSEFRKATPALIEKSLERINSTASIFSIQLLSEWLSLDSPVLEAMENTPGRINMPGTVGESNWSIISPYSVEKLKRLSINDTIKNINAQHNRI
jgi:4-alpha-glucanotransferase